MDESLDEKLAALSVATLGEVYDLSKDPNGETYGWMVEAVETRETLDQFIESANGYREKTALKRGTLAGFPFIAYRQIQAFKGQPRRALSVIDFGDVRYALDADLADYTRGNDKVVIVLSN